MRLELDDTTLDDEEPFDIDFLERHRLRSDILERMGAGVSRRRDESVQRGTGRLPQAALGGIVHERIWGEMEGLHRSLDRHRDALASPPVEIDFEIGGYRLTGSVENAGPEGLVWWRPATLRARDRIDTWLRLLALAATGHGARNAVALSIEKGKPSATSFSAPEDPRERLLAWLDAWRAGRSAPLRFFPETSLAYAGEAARGADEAVAREKARQAWSPSHGSWNRDGELERDPYLRLVYDGRDPLTGPFETLAAELLGPVVEAMQ